MKFFWQRQEVNHAPFVAKYLELPFDVGKTVPIDDLTFCVFDCETTGLGKKSELVSVGAVKVARRRIDIQNVLDLSFDFSTNTDSALIHGKLKSEVKESTGKSEDIIEFIGNSILVGHNVSIDIAAVESLLKKEGHHLKLKNRVVDTFSLMRRIDPNRLERTVGGNLRLDTLCEEMDIPVENRHTALGDAYLTAQLLLKELSLLKKRKVINAGTLLK